MSKNLISLLLSIIFIQAIVFGQTQKNSVTSILNSQINQSDFGEENEEITSALMKSFYSTKVPAGVSRIFRDYTKIEYEPKLIFSSKKMTLQNILTQVTTIEPHYQWKEENGVINVFPINDYSFLNITIPDFHFENNTKEELLSKVLNANELQQYMKENNLSVSPFNSLEFGGLQGRRVEPRKFTVNLKNVSIREILNEIVRQNGKSTWIYSEYQSDHSDKENTRRYYTLRFLVDIP